MKKTLQEKEGFTLLITIIGLALMTTLGFAILTSTTNNFKATNDDSKNQSAYYIAEAGINYAIDNINTLMNSTNDVNSTAFFSNLNTKIDALPLTLYFDENFGVVPNVSIIITPIDVDNITKEYLIESIGMIGESKRTVNSTVSITWSKEEVQDSGYDPNVAFNTNNFQFSGPQIKAPKQTIVVSSGDWQKIQYGSKFVAEKIYFKDTSDMKIAGKEFKNDGTNINIYLSGNAEFTSQEISIRGNVFSKKNFIFGKKSEISNNLFVKENLTLNQNTQVGGDVYVGGKMSMGFSKIKGNVYVFNGFESKADDEGDRSIEIQGNLYVEGYADLRRMEVKGEVFVNGNLRINNKTEFKSNVTYTGNLITEGTINNDILKKISKVSQISKESKPDFDFIVPSQCAITKKTDKWYSDNKYNSSKNSYTGKILKGTDWVVEDYNMTEWQDEIKNSVIISQGNINITRTNNFEGVLISLNGSINFTGSASFKGVAISNKEIIMPNGGLEVNIQTLKDYFNNEELPVNINCSNSENNPGNGQLPGNNIPGKKNSIITIKKNIKEQ